MIFNFRKKELHIELKEREIQQAKHELHKKIDNDIRNINKLNKVLSNGITLEIYKATGGRHG